MRNGGNRLSIGAPADRGRAGRSLADICQPIERAKGGNAHYQLVGGKAQGKGEVHDGVLQENTQ